MEIIIRDIPEEGQSLDFNAAAGGWFRKVLAESLPELFHKGDAGKVHIDLLRTEGNVDARGEIDADYHPACVRCLKNFKVHLSVPFHLVLAPLYESDRQPKLEEKDEVELVMEDLDFAYYEGDRFNLGNVLREQIILAIPMQPLCDTDCKGLCQHCGNDLNKGPCNCQEEHQDPRWAPLKVFKTKT